MISNGEDDLIEWQMRKSNILTVKGERELSCRPSSQHRLGLQVGICDGGGVLQLTTYELPRIPCLETPPSSSRKAKRGLVTSPC